MQSVSLSLPGVEVLPGGQLVQYTVPDATEYVPFLHLSHVAAPSAEENVPGAHFEQTVAPVLENCPALQSAHVLEAGARGCRVLAAHTSGARAHAHSFRVFSSHTSHTHAQGACTCRHLSLVKLYTFRQHIEYTGLHPDSKSRRCIDSFVSLSSPLAHLSSLGTPCTLYLR